uniref:Uncharacterized protein n=1 Tax=Rubinisphaera brasiliensis (strain ATCC 49424 / DSM 5305 / JCM 21570 / IAM 15109 / NBRC 103401 / IFAM 1448) TaxID=756272 RepID=F0SR01_RUBBR|nr:hypothetical protein Plabr_2622 [Rubinisphaera brasiliensis DSM 5305]
MTGWSRVSGCSVLLSHLMYSTKWMLLSHPVLPTESMLLSLGVARRVSVAHQVRSG